jgi:hypothetical protein
MLPSKILTAVGKSLTRRAALRAAVMTEVEGTRSYAKALLRLRWSSKTSVTESNSFSYLFSAALALVAWRRAIGDVGLADVVVVVVVGVEAKPAHGRASHHPTISIPPLPPPSSPRAPGDHSGRKKKVWCESRWCEGGNGSPYLAVNSSKLSSWASE